MGLLMQGLEVIGVVTLIGLLVTAEGRNQGVSKFFNSLGGATSAIASGIGPYSNSGGRSR